LPTPPRRLALQVLREIARERGTLADALAAPELDRLAERDRALLHELVLGTLRRRGWLDHALAGLASRPLAALDPGVLDALRLAAYQLLFTRIPAHAALSEAVDLVREIAPRATGFANAILRRLQREGPPAAADPTADPLLWLTTAGSLPRWLAERWLVRLGAARAVARARALLETPPTHFRVHPRVADVPGWLSSVGLAARPTFVPGAFELLAGRLTGPAAEGLVYVQDAGAQMVAQLAATRGRVLDACAAPGGKSLLLADHADVSLVVAAEASLRRVRTLARICARWGASRVRVLAADARRPPFRAAFDGVLLDAPCSGLGTLARHPDIRWRIHAHDLARHAERQRDLLEAVCTLVRPGGRLVYATCSVEPEENEDIVQPFLVRHPDFAPQPAAPWAESLHDGAFLRMEPAATSGDAFFVAALRRAEAGERI
jgi:16S rRNA (cytosine967-C5)-methyltransferase